MDTEGHLSSIIPTINKIIENDLIATPGVFIVNVYGQRERGKVKNDYVNFGGFRRYKQERKFLAEIDQGTFENYKQQLFANPLELRSDAITEGLLGAIETNMLVNKKTILQQLIFLRKYLGNIDDQLRALARNFSLEEKISEEERKVLSSFSKGELCTEEALVKSRNLKLNLTTPMYDHLLNVCESHKLIQAIYTAFFDPLQVSGHKRLQYTSKTKGKMYMDMVAINRASTSGVAPYLREFRDSLYYSEGKLAPRLYRDSRKRPSKIRKEYGEKLELIADFFYKTLS
ncbi:hypothetical protein HYT23_07070, partial [Candidatus Pacearchaeota archaeon]|nr:hypothetical protein [Candidatus Pacearchaeota archaeon]